MKFSFKIVIGTMFITVLMFTLAGIILIYNNFTNSYKLQINNNIEEHYLEKSSILNNINENIDSEGNISTETLKKYLYTLTSYLENSRNIMIYINDDIIWNNVPFKVDFSKTNESVLIKEYESKKYSIISSSIEVNDENVLIKSVYDITDVFRVRETNLLCFYIIDFILLICCGILTTIFAKLLTKPIKELNQKTKEITRGNLDVLINVNTCDEIGELTNSFNIMTKSIKSKIKELERSVKQREDFVSNFTHELKTPMTSIMGYAKVLKQNKYSKEDKEKALDYIYSESKRLEVLSHKMLDLFKITNDKINMEKIDAVNFFHELESFISKELKPINLKFEIEKGTFKGDKELLLTCFKNLIENSKKASKQRDEIKIVGNIINDKYRVSVIDKGIGIEKEELSRITESFYMIDKSRNKKSGSYGIGLALCEKIALVHNTSLSFKSKVGSGTTVSLELEMDDYETK